MPRPAPSPDAPLRIAWLVYRGNPYCGGQGVYTRYLARELSALGHDVTVFSGPPYPHLDHPEQLLEVPSLDLYAPPHPFWPPKPWELKTTIDWREFGIMCAAGFPEPYTFSLRARRLLKERRDDFDIVHDNQCLGTGLLTMMKEDDWPVLCTLHHPITVDRDLDLAHAPNAYRRFVFKRWYGFLNMQMRVAREIPRLVTVSENSKHDIVEQMAVPADRLHIVPVGVDEQVFKPLPHVARVPGRLMTTTSSDVPLKGLAPLLEALAKVRAERDDVELVIIGQPKKWSKIPDLIERLGVGSAIRFVSGVSTERIVELYAEAQVAVVPSLYEGFSLPAVEAMACGVPLVATTGGALPEVVGRDGDTGLLVPPGDVDALATGILRALGDPDLRARIGPAGRERVLSRFTWRETAIGTVENYRALLDELAGQLRVLTVDFDRLDVGHGQRVLDLGCGGGRHTCEAIRRGATVVALDYDFDTVDHVRGLLTMMVEQGQLPSMPPGGAVNADALALPFPDATFDRIIASEVLEHIWADELAISELVRILRPGGRLAVTVPTRFPERVCWALDRDYHDVPGGHIRIYRQRDLETKLARGGLALQGAHHAHALHSPYWWLKCAVGVNDDDAWPVRKYHDLLVWQISKQPAWLDGVDRALNPVIGKSLVVYTQKPVAEMAGVAAR